MNDFYLIAYELYNYKEHTSFFSIDFKTKLLQCLDDDEMLIHK